MAFLIYSAIALLSYFFYNFLSNEFEEKVQGKPPLVQNSWLEFLTGRGADVRTLIKRGYEKYSKNGLPFRYYEGFGYPEYVMPPSHFASIRKSLDSVLSSSLANEDNLVMNPFLGEDGLDIVLPVRNSITKSLNSLMPTIANEIAASMRTHFPSKPDAKHPLVISHGITWSPTNIHHATLRTIGRVISRILLGEKYASDEEFTLLISDFAQGIVFQAFLLRLLPLWLVYRIAPFFNTTKRVKKIKAYVREDILALLRAPLPQKGEVTQPKEGEELLLLPMLIDHSRRQESFQNYTEEEQIKSIMARLLGIAFATIDTTTITLTHVMQDMIGSPFAQYAGPIQEQARQVKAANGGGEWSVKSLSELTKLDSFVKEVQRLRPLGYILAKRMVLPGAGAVFVSGAGPLDIPGYDGATSGPEIFVPQNHMVMMPTWGVHSDDAVYEDAETFKGFRFENDKIASSQPTDRFLSFGHGMFAAVAIDEEMLIKIGRHACPGRHVALSIIKLFVLEFLDTFEYKEGQERLKAWSFQTACVPDMDGRVLIRRKKENHGNGNGAANGFAKVNGIV